MNDRVARDAKSLSELLDIYSEWCTRDQLEVALERARADGDTTNAAVFADVLNRMPEPLAAVHVLGAQHEVSRLLAGWEWHTVRAAREQGASWAEISEATDTEPHTARAAYLSTITRQEHAAERFGHGLSAAEAARYRAAAGQWYDELFEGTPVTVVAQIQDAIARDDQDTLEQLRGRWWDPTRRPHCGDPTHGPTAGIEQPTTTADPAGTSDAAPDDGHPSPPPARSGTARPAAHRALTGAAPSTRRIGEPEARVERAESPAAPRGTDEHIDDLTGVNPERGVTDATDDRATSSPGAEPSRHAVESARDAMNGLRSARATADQAGDRMQCTPPWAVGAPELAVERGRGVSADGSDR